MTRIPLPGLAADSIPPPPSIPEVFLGLVNAARANGSYRALLGHPTLDACAQGRVKDMIDQGYFGHRDPLGVVSDEYTGRLAAHGVTVYAWAGENLGMTNAANWQPQLMQLWMASPGHRANILSPDFDTMGVGHGLRSDMTHVVCHIFTGGARL